jgi:hypothetical protein
VSVIEAEFEGIPADDVKKIVRDNALEYFRVRESVAA